MLFIKYSKDKRKLQELTSKNSGFQSLELKAARVIDSITGINLRFTETEGSVNMYQAVQEMCDDARAEGLSQGRAQGLSQGLQEHALLTAQRMDHLAPLPRKTTITVLTRISISSFRHHSAMYFVSSSTTSSKSVISLRPLTCHIPVSPGLMARRLRW